MTKPFLETSQERLLVARFDIDHAIRVEPSLRKGRSEKIGACDAPEDLALGSRGDTGDKEGSCRTINRAVAASRNFMQRAAREATFG